MVITGLRGVGKTVLLGRFRDKALEHDWVVVELEVSKNDESAFRREIAAKLRTVLFQLSPKARWTERFKQAAAVLKSFTLQVEESGGLSAGFDVDAAEGFADHANLTMDLTDVLLAMGEAAAENGRGVVLLIDEVQFLSGPQLEAVIAALHKTVQRKLPVTMVGAGLPQIAELAGDARSYAERLFKFPTIGRLSPEDAKLDRATPLQSAYLRAMAQLGPEPQKASDVADVMGRTSQNLGPTRAELINMGLLYTPEHGYAAFTVPHFDRFLLRAIPELVVPELKPRKRAGDRT